jgi:hypothetical protein
MYGPDIKSAVMRHPGNKGGGKFKCIYLNHLDQKITPSSSDKISEVYDPPMKRLFNLDKDPSERSDLLNILPIDYTPYQDIIANIIKKEPAAPKPRKTIKSTKESLDTLRALGYIQ